MEIGQKVLREQAIANLQRSAQHLIKQAHELKAAFDKFMETKKIQKQIHLMHRH